MLLILVVWGAGKAWLPPALAHPGQHLDLRIAISDEEIRYDILISADFRNVLVPTDFDKLTLSPQRDRFLFTDQQEERRTRAAFEECFRNANPVTVDGVQVQPIFKELEFLPAVMPGLPAAPEQMPPDAHVVLSYPTKGRPKQVSMVWDLYPQDPTRALYGLGPSVEVIAQLDAYDENKIVVFAADEPELVWHAPGVPLKRRVSPVVAAVEPAVLTIPLLSLGIVGLWGTGLLVLRFSRVWRGVRRPALGSSVVALGAALLCHDVLVARAAAPWGAAVKLPSAEEAAEIFTSLQRNVYRAFEYKTESDTYDVLARSVDGELLDQVYNEVHQGLILRDQGGAAARVRSVDILSAEFESAGVLADSSAAAFRVRSRWQVHAAVYHWGHVHARTNEYVARYTVAQRGNNWKITAVDVLEQRRIASESDDPPLLPP